MCRLHDPFTPRQGHSDPYTQREEAATTRAAVHDCSTASVHSLRLLARFRLRRQLPVLRDMVYARSACAARSCSSSGSVCRHATASCSNFVIVQSISNRAAVCQNTRTAAWRSHQAARNTSEDSVTPTMGREARLISEAAP